MVRQDQSSKAKLPRPVDKAALMAAQSQSFIEGQRVWVPLRSSSSAWACGVIVGVSRGADEKVMLSVELGEDKKETLSVPAMQCFLQNERDPDDLTKSDYLHEPGILQTLRSRFDLDTIYTYSGQILIALNPFKPLKHLYGPRMMAEYKGLESLEDLSPHCYAVAENAYQNMMIDGNRQAVLISGESGAGKTVTARLVMAYLAERSGQGALTAMPIEQQILESNPLLEAFGNAKTVRNDNSSRFGKFVEIDFSETGRVSGAYISTYLLERSRVVSISDPERSFHIFYQLLAGCPDALRARLFLPPAGVTSGASAFAYLAQSTTTKLTGTDDVKAFNETINAMKIVGLDDEHIEAVLAVVAAVLHLGNINFETAEHATADEAVICQEEASINALNSTAELLGTSSAELRQALMSRKISIGGDVIVKEFNVLECIESRDSLAKSLYGRLFDWIVSAVNGKIGSVGGGGRTPRTIGILDIYGFEAFDTNSFEQLCINLANEKLQQSFNEHVFKEEQKVYLEEDIDWSYVDFVDNQDVLDLLEGTNLSATNVLPPNIGVFPLLDEACRLPRATNQDLAITIREKLQKHPRFSAPKRDPSTFCINHYAGEVRYDTSAHMLERNRDFRVLEQETLLVGSSRWLPRALFDLADINEQSHSSFKLSTIGSMFCKQLNALSDKLAQVDPHYIRCIKPNEGSSPGLLQPSYVMDQLRAGGVLEAVRIACAGFPTRKDFEPFARRYIVLASKEDLLKGRFPRTDSGTIDWLSLSLEQEAAIVEAIMNRTGLEGWQLGRSRLFLRTGHLACLEASRGRILTDSVLKIQAVWRAYAARVRYQKIVRTQKAALCIQTFWRMRVVQNQYELIRQQQREMAAAVCIQSHWRMIDARRAFIAQSSSREEKKRQEAELAAQEAMQEAERARRATIATELETENGALKAEVAALKSTVADLECRLAESISVSMHASQASAIQDLHDKMEQLNLCHENEMDVLRKSLANSKAREQESDRVISTKNEEILRLSEQLETATARLEQVSSELSSARVNYADELQQAASKASEKIAQLELLLVAEKESSSQNTTTIQAMKNDNAIMSSRIDSLLQQLERGESEISQLRTTAAMGTTARSTSAVTYLSGDVSRSSSLDVERLVPRTVAIMGKNDNPCSFDLDEGKTNLVDLVVQHLVRQPSTIVDLKGVPLPLNSWRLRNFIRYVIHDAGWNTAEVLCALDTITSEIVVTAATSFSTCLGALNMAVAASALIKVEAVGQSQHAVYVQASNKFLDITQLWTCLADYVVDKVPLNVGSLLKEDARKSARVRGSKMLRHESSSLTIEQRLEGCMGSSSRDWMNLIGSIDTLIFLLLDASMPEPTLKAIVWATLRYIDGSIFNALLMRPELCSTSSARAILTALAIVESYMTTYRNVSISTEEFREAFQRTLQASWFLAEWFDDAVRQARGGMVKTSIAKCSALTLLQVKRIAEQRHDELMPCFGSNTDTKILLQALKSMMASEEDGLPMSASVSGSFLHNAEHAEQASATMMTPKKQRAWPSDSNIMPSPLSPDTADEGDMAELLVDCHAVFALSRRGLTKRLLRETSIAFFQGDGGLSFIDASCRAVRVPEALPLALAFLSKTCDRGG